MINKKTITVSGMLHWQICIVKEAFSLWKVEGRGRWEKSVGIGELP